MTAYTKHTDGEAYTLNGSNYIGFLHIDDDVPKTGQYQTIDSLVLTPRQTFISSLFDKKHQTDTTFKSISGLTPYYSNVFDILNRPGLEHAFGNVDTNNLIVFKNLILGHPTIYQYEENNGFFYGLSAANLDILNGKNGYMDIVPFAKDKYWAFMDNIICGSFVINSKEEFKYLCSTGTNNYVLSGSFLDKNTVLTKLSEYDQHPYATQTPEYTHHIHNDVTNNKILYVNDNFINVYDSSNYDECNNLILIDKLPLKLCDTNEYVWNRTTSKWKDFADKWSTRFNTKNPNNPEFIKFGKNIRTSIDGKILSIINKYSSDVYQKIDLSKWINGSCISLDVREIDDNIIILHRDVEKLYILMLDPKNLELSSNTQIYSIITSFDEYVIKFSEFDSNVFFLSNSKEYQSRYVSNPKYPAGRLETCDLGYQNSFVWNKVDQKWGAMRWRWKSEASSNNYNNLLASQLVKNDKMYMLLHNIGRLYVIKQPLHDRFLSAIPLDTEKFYNGISCSESSLGLYFNTAISNLVKDTLNLFNQSLGSFSIYERKVITKQLNDFVLKTDNLYINGNETINVITLQRIFILLTEIQSKLLPVTVEI